MWKCGECGNVLMLQHADGTQIVMIVMIKNDEKNVLM